MQRIQKRDSSNIYHINVEILIFICSGNTINVIIPWVRVLILDLYVSLSVLVAKVIK